jgi:hypothetical protein
MVVGDERGSRAWGRFAGVAILALVAWLLWRRRRRSEIEPALTTEPALSSSPRTLWVLSLTTCLVVGAAIAVAAVGPVELLPEDEEGVTRIGCFEALPTLRRLPLDLRMELLELGSDLQLLGKKGNDLYFNTYEDGYILLHRYRILDGKELRRMGPVADPMGFVNSATPISVEAGGFVCYTDRRTPIKCPELKNLFFSLSPAKRADLFRGANRVSVRPISPHEARVVSVGDDGALMAFTLTSRGLVEQQIGGTYLYFKGGGLSFQVAYGRPTDIDCGRYA